MFQNHAQSLPDPLVLFWPLGAPARDSSAGTVFTTVGPRFRGSKALFGNPKRHSDTDFHKFLGLLASRPNFQSYDPTTISLTPSEPPRMRQSVQKRTFRLERAQISPKRPVSSLRVGGMIVSKNMTLLTPTRTVKTQLPFESGYIFYRRLLFKNYLFGTIFCYPFDPPWGSKTLLIR